MAMYHEGLSKSRESQKFKGAVYVNRDYVIFHVPSDFSIDDYRKVGESWKAHMYQEKLQAVEDDDDGEG